MDNINKLKVFSKKLNGPVTVAAGAPENEAAPSVVAYGWMNNGWSNNVWANTFQWLNGWHNGTTWVNNMGWNNHGWTNGGGGGCFITTACVEHVGLSDDCDELTTLRYFRDKLVQEDSEFREKVLEYYEKAPLIVEKIQASEDKDAVLDDLYANMIQPCISLLKQGEVEEAKELYLNAYEGLVETYLNE